jgi:hypothetical protein
LGVRSQAPSPGDHVEVPSDGAALWADGGEDQGGDGGVPEPERRFFRNIGGLSVAPVSLEQGRGQYIKVWDFGLKEK